MRNLQFHQSFKLDRKRLATLVRCIADNETISKKAIAAYMGVGEPAAEGCLGWLVKSGLGRSQKGINELSPFGILAAKHDPDLTRSGTLWLLHYFLASEHEECAEVWHQCFNTFLYPGMSFSREELQEHIQRNLPENSTNKAAVEKDTKELVKTYSQAAALGSLGIMTQQADKKLVAGLATSPEVSIVAYVLFDTWRRRYNDTNTLRLSQLVSEPETPGRIFVATPAQVREFILHLQAQGLLTFADTQHEPVTRRFHDHPTILLEQYYQR